MPFLMIRNDIAKVAADAIVNPANRNLLQGSGTSRAIYQAAGEQELTASCEAIGRCDLGRAVCTPAFGLPAKYIFHAVCPAWHGGFFGEAKQLAGAYHSALELAAEYHCESVAFPLLSSGNYGYLRSRNPNLQVVLVQPHPDSRLTPEHPDAQIIDGVLPAYDVPESALSDYLRPDWSDACINVRTEEAYETAHEVLRAEGLFLGTSAAAALHAAVQMGRRPENQGKNIVVIVPDNGMKYLSAPMYRQK